MPFTELENKEEEQAGRRGWGGMAKPRSLLWEAGFEVLWAIQGACPEAPGDAGLVLRSSERGGARLRVTGTERAGAAGGQWGAELAPGGGTAYEPRMKF